MLYMRTVLRTAGVSRVHQSKSSDSALGWFPCIVFVLLLLFRPCLSLLALAPQPLVQQHHPRSSDYGSNSQEEALAIPTRTGQVSRATSFASQHLPRHLQPRRSVRMVHRLVPLGQTVAHGEHWNQFERLGRTTVCAGCSRSSCATRLQRVESRVSSSLLFELKHEGLKLTR